MALLHGVHESLQLSVSKVVGEVLLPYCDALYHYIFFQNYFKKYLFIFYCYYMACIFTLFGVNLQHMKVSY